jgi:hypothetical protein
MNLTTHMGLAHGVVAAERNVWSSRDAGLAEVYLMIFRLDLNPWSEPMEGIFDLPSQRLTP